MDKNNDDIEINSFSFLDDKNNIDNKENNSNDEIDHHTCPICIHLLLNPILTPCKHSFCLNCYLECSELSSKRICPICRSPIPSTFEPNIDKLYTQKLKELYPDEIKDREKYLEELNFLGKEFLRLRINFGNTCELVEHKGNTVFRWLAHLKLERDEDAKKYIDYVLFELHPTYPGDKFLKITGHPYEVQRLARGPFTLHMTIYFTSIVESPPLKIDHFLVFDGDGITKNRTIKIKLKPPTKSMKFLKMLSEP